MVNTFIAERLIEKDGKHYWLQSDGSMRETDWKLRCGLPSLISNTVKLVRLLLALRR